MDKSLFLEDLLNKIDDLTHSIEERIEEGDDLALARELLEEVREEVEFRLETY